MIALFFWLLFLLLVSHSRGLRKECLDLFLDPLRDLFSLWFQLDYRLAQLKGLEMAFMLQCWFVYDIDRIAIQVLGIESASYSILGDTVIILLVFKALNRLRFWMWKKVVKEGIFLMIFQRLFAFLRVVVGRSKIRHFAKFLIYQISNFINQISGNKLILILTT